MSHLFLVGFMGSGKSVVGREVARITGRTFVDLDADVERAEGRPITAIFEREGEAGFRAAEREALLRLEDAQPSVVACGGGIVGDPANRADLKRLGRVVWLQVDAEQVEQRVGGRAGRPLLGSSPGEIRELMDVREPLYREVGEAVVDTRGRTVGQVADEVVRVSGEAS